MIRKAELQKVGTRGDLEVYAVGGVGFTPGRFSNHSSANAEYSTNSSTIFDDNGITTYKTVMVDGKEYQYIPFGANDQLPYDIIAKVGENMVMSQNKLFNVLTCYGQGVRFYDRKTNQQTKNEEVSLFKFRNSLERFYLEQVMDMKYFFFTITCVILDREGCHIVQMRHKESSYCRFTKANDKGRIEHVL